MKYLWGTLLAFALLFFSIGIIYLSRAG